MAQVQVQVRLPPKTIEEIDKWIDERRFKSRSDAIRAILNIYQEREKTREFLKLLGNLDQEITEHPERLIPLEEV
jgi:Arc/MetJ-type ribon-helix-helix transcriptional regulator